ncbi:DUF6879 family protein [Kitasatospora sp. NPDC098652]|uniref:DUF6879 family protein n=1 Tax=Kitasatospora sp. NPDC098652 TaxID=3364095 RepID=UPI0037F87BA2
MPVPEFVPQRRNTEFANDGFDHTARRLEARTGYLSDQRMPSYAEFLRTGDTAGEVGHPWFDNVRRMAGNAVRHAEFRSRLPEFRGGG